MMVVRFYALSFNKPFSNDFNFWFFGCKPFQQHVVAAFQYVYQDISKKWFMFGDKYYFFIFIVCYL